MRILDEQGKELTPQEVDKEVGYLEPDSIQVGVQPAREEVLPVFHYEVRKWYFADGTAEKVGSNSDPSVRVINDKKGIFEYVDQQGEGKQVTGSDLELVYDSAGSPAVESQPIMENIYRYRKYTERELEAIQAKKKAEEFLKDGPEKIEEIIQNLDNLVVMIAEMAGVD